MSGTITLLISARVDHIMNDVEITTKVFQRNINRARQI